MLFDLGTGKKKRFIQVIYGLLALLFLVGFVGFGIGGEVGQGGIADIFTGGSDDLEETQFSEDADEIEKKLESDPRNQALLEQLISTRFSAGNALSPVDPETGVPTVTEEAEQEYEQAAEAWERYLALNPDPVDTGAALFAVQSFSALAGNATTVTEAEANWEAAADAQQVLAQRRPTLGNFSNLAIYSYFSLDYERGDKAADRAAQLAANPAARKRIKRQLSSYRQQAKSFEAQQRREEQQENQGADNGAPDVPENPLDPSGGEGALTPPQAP